MSKFEKRQQAISNGSHGLVIGSGIAGLLAARVLLNHFAFVTVVERDSLPEQPGARPGVPQTLHSHGLLKRGSNILEQLFPGLEAELVAAGAILTDQIADTLTLIREDSFPRCPSDLIVPSCSRCLLEWSIRRRLSKSDRLQFLDATQVKKLLTDETNSRITGVQLLDRDDLQLGELTADLVVDASGRQSNTPKWLEELGYPAPCETKVNAFLGYTTRWYERPQQLDADWKTLLVMSNSHSELRSGVLAAMEGNRWVLSLYGFNQDYPPTDEVGFLEFARTLSNPALYQTVKDAKPVSPIYSFRNTENRLRHYEKLKLPEGLVVMGDAVFAFNPFYGQGMSAAAVGALDLDRCLAQQLGYRTNLSGLSDRYSKQLAQSLQAPWLLATNRDQARLSAVDAATTGKKIGLSDRLSRQYGQEVEALLKSNPESYRSLMEIYHMVKTPTALFNLKFALNVAKQVWKRNIANYSHAIWTVRSLTPPL
ncbi:MAG: 2-polyprenyl-6-methoxyphenol hydroxylase-like oxidoreductase [Microcoleus sp. SIO2G3]|nr:2-polyprenyl-6-methoxyphenol hydroxylase-like oxidoreductase [Microcoleus sp. SIO2G3]